MQGLEALNEFKSFVSKLGGLGRYEDTYMVHAAEGETVVPMEVLDQNPVLKKRLFKTMMDMGIEPGRYIVGNELNSKNPITGQPEFFLKKIVSQIRKAIPGDLENYLGPIVGLATGNPYLGAIAGGIGSGVPGAIAGGFGGFQSPGIEGLGRGAFGYKGAGKMDAMKLFGKDGIFSKEGGMDFLFGNKDKRGLFGKFDFRGDAGDVAEKSRSEITKQILDENPGLDINSETFNTFYKNEVVGAKKAAESVLAGMSIMDAAKLYGLGTAGLGLLIKLTDDQGDVGNRKEKYKETGNLYEGIVNRRMDFADNMPIIGAGMAEGGVLDLQEGGESVGPGTGTSDSIPAMLSDGEFVMTAKAVRGAGGGDRREGARKMYEAMDRLEARA